MGYYAPPLQPHMMRGGGGGGGGFLPNNVSGLGSHSHPGYPPQYQQHQPQQQFPPMAMQLGPPQGQHPMAYQHHTQHQHHQQQQHHLQHQHRGPPPNTNAVQQQQQQHSAEPDGPVLTDEFIESLISDDIMKQDDKKSDGSNDNGEDNDDNDCDDGTQKKNSNDEDKSTTTENKKEESGSSSNGDNTTASTTTSTTSTKTKGTSAKDDMKLCLVIPKDRDLIPDSLFVALGQMKPCKLTQADRVGCYKTRNIGFLGMCCKHCGGQPGFGRFFPNSVRSLAQTTTSQTILKHLGGKCRFCPSDVRKAVLELQRQQAHKENLTTGRPRYGSRKIFFQRMWARLHGQSEDGVTAIVVDADGDDDGVDGENSSSSTSLTSKEIVSTATATASSETTKKVVAAATSAAAKGDISAEETSSVIVSTTNGSP